MAVSRRPRIPTPAEPVVDPQTGLMNTTWYDWLLSLGETERLQDYPNDALAAAGGVPLYGLYRSGSTVKVRVT